MLLLFAFEITMYINLAFFWAVKILSQFQADLTDMKKTNMIKQGSRQIDSVDGFECESNWELSKKIKR